MSLCRLLSRRGLISLFRASTVTPTKNIISYHFEQLNCVEFSPKPFHTRFNSSIHQFSYNESGRKSKWRRHLFLMLVASLGGVSAFLRYYRDVAYCEVKKEEESHRIDTELWKGVKITLYQYQTCPFCTKVRFFLTYYKIPFEIVEVHPIFKKELKFSDYKKVPFITVETDQGTQHLKDSSLIISVLSTYMVNERTKQIQDILNDYPSTELITQEGKKKEVVLNKYWIIKEEPDQATNVSEKDPRQVESEWREWTDDHLVHLISPNVYRTYSEAYQAFDHHVKMGKYNGTWEGIVAKLFGSVAMWGISKKLKKKYHMQDDVRLDLYFACNKWIDTIGSNRFLGGNQPNLADLSVFAVLSVMEGLVSFDDMIKYTKIKPWYFRMKRTIEGSLTES